MVIHIGWEICVQSEDVFAILNKSTALSATGGRNPTAAFIQQAKNAGRFTASPEGDRSYVLTIEQGNAHVYASAINAATLARRVQGSIQE